MKTKFLIILTIIMLIPFVVSFFIENNDGWFKTFSLVCLIPFFVSFFYLCYKAFKNK